MSARVLGLVMPFALALACGTPTPEDTAPARDAQPAISASSDGGVEDALARRRARIARLQARQHELHRHLQRAADPERARITEELEALNAEVKELEKGPPKQP